MNQFTDSIATFEAAINMAEAYLANNTAPSPLHEMEREIQALTRVIGQAMLAQRVAQCGTGEAGTHLDDARKWRFHGIRSLTYRSIFGSVPIRWAYYHHAEQGGFCPLDASQGSIRIMPIFVASVHGQASREDRAWARPVRPLASWRRRRSDTRHETLRPESAGTDTTSARPDNGGLIISVGLGNSVVGPA